MNIKREQTMFVVGYWGTVGSAIVGQLPELCLTPISTTHRPGLGLLDQAAARRFCVQYQMYAANFLVVITYSNNSGKVFLVASTDGNLPLQTNLITATSTSDADRPLPFGSDI